MTHERCRDFGCRMEHPIDQAFYVSCRNDEGQTSFLAGPFPDHAMAMGHVLITKKQAERFDHRACWYSYGTLGVQISKLAADGSASKAPIGILNDVVGLEVTA
jgi:hypothetical protein